MDTAERLAVLRFDKEVQAVKDDRLIECCTEKGLQRTEHQLLLPAFGHPARQRKSKTELFENIRVAPQFQISFLLAVERMGLVSGQFAWIERGTQPVEGSGALGSQGLQGRGVATGTQAEGAVEVAEDEGRQGNRMLPAAEIRQGCPQVGLGQGRLEPKQRHQGRLQTMTGRDSGQFPQGLGFKAEHLGLREQLAAEGIPAQPSVAQMPERGARGEGVGNGESHIRWWFADNAWLAPCAHISSSLPPTLRACF